MKCSGKEWDTCRVEKMGCTGCHYSEAKEIFEEAGYKETKTNCFQIARYKKDDNNVIHFDKDKTFGKTGEYDGMCGNFTMQELRAVCKKCREEGWI